MFDATGFSPIVWEAAEVLGKNGVLVLASITGGDRKVEINSRPDQPGLRARQQGHGRHRQRGAERLQQRRRRPHQGRGDLPRLARASCSRRPIEGLENYEEMIRALTEDRDAIKVYVEVARNGQ